MLSSQPCKSYLLTQHLNRYVPLQITSLHELGTVTGHELQVESLGLTFLREVLAVPQLLSGARRTA